MLQVTLAGLLMCFSKETGAVIYGVGAGVLWWSLTKNGRAGRDALLLAIPLVIFVASILLPKALAVTHTLSMWGVTETGGLWFLGDFQPFNLWSRILLSYAMLVTVLQFQWIATLSISVGLFAMLRAGKFRWKHLTPTSPWRRVALTLCASLAAVTTYHTYSNLRYFALFLPFLWLGAVIVARTLEVAVYLRRLALFVSTCCLFVFHMVVGGPRLSSGLRHVFDRSRPHVRYDQHLRRVLWTWTRSPRVQLAVCVVRARA